GRARQISGSWRNRRSRPRRCPRNRRATTSDGLTRNFRARISNRGCASFETPASQAPQDEEDLSVPPITHLILRSTRRVRLEGRNAAVQQSGSFGTRFGLQRRQQVDLAGQVCRYRQVEVTVRGLGQHATARGALYEALLQ